MAEGEERTGLPRWVIVLLAVGSLVAVLAVEFFLALSGLACLNEAERSQEEVRCEERETGWTTVLAVLFIATPLVVLAAGIAGVVGRRPRWLAIGAAATVPALAAIPAIYEIDLPDETQPYIRTARLGSDVCHQQRQPRCAEGIPLSFMLSEEAEVEFLLVWDSPGRPPPPLQPFSGVAAVRIFAPDGSEIERAEPDPERERRGEGERPPYEFEGGDHTVRVAPRAEGAADLPPGRYLLEVGPVPNEEINTQAERESADKLVWPLRFEALPG